VLKRSRCEREREREKERERVLLVVDVVAAIGIISKNLITKLEFFTPFRCAFLAFFIVQFSNLLREQQA
jgi:hypothetical protein